MCKDQNDVQQRLCDYMAQDLAVHKMQVNEYKRGHNKMLALVIILSALVVASVAGFAVTVYFITTQHTEQIHAIFGSSWERTVETGRADVDQESGDNGDNTAIVNNGSTIIGSAINAKTLPK